MSENRGIQKSGTTPNYMQLTVIGQDHIKIEVTVEAETFNQGLDKLDTMMEELRVTADGYDKIAEVANLRSVPVAEQVPVAKNEVAEPVGVTADRYSDALLDAMIRLIRES